MARRAKLKEEIPKFIPPMNINWQPLLDYFNRTLLQISRGEGRPKDFEHFVFEKVVALAYDKKAFFKWWNEYASEY